jgi:hypothetical protein
MKLPLYSSLAAFMAHYQTLKALASRTSDEQQLFSEMTAALTALPPETRAALDSTDSSASAKRHRERAEIQLRRELIARGIVSG